MESILVVYGGEGSLIVDDVPCGVRLFLASTAHGWPAGPGAGLTPVTSGVWSAFPRICRPVPGPGGGVAAGSGCDLVGADPGAGDSRTCAHRLASILSS